MADSTVNNKRIAKNTIFLYIRMLVIMGVSLYTSRVVLSTLGVENYGIYNLVAGVVVLFSFLNNAMVSSTQRFLNYEMGAGSQERLQSVFAMSINCHVIVALFVVLLAETIGLWLLNNELVIPSERIFAANVVYQLAILQTCINILYAPFNAAIIASEKMDIFAYISIAEVFLKLAIVYVLIITSSDRLILYSILMVVVSSVISLSYIVYCNIKLYYTKYRFMWDCQLFRSLMGFSGWSLLGGVANMVETQGINMILNMFFGVVANAAMGVANQVLGALSSFVNNFSVAFNPQIIKSYASGEKNYFFKLIHNTSRYCYLMFFCLSFPVLVYCDDILSWWLVNPPQYSVSFCRLVILISLVDSINTPLWTAVRASGRIKKYNVVTSALRVSAIPICYVGFKTGLDPTYALIVNLSLDIIIQGWIIYHLRGLIELDIKMHAVHAILPCALITLVALPLPLLIHHYSDGLLSTILGLIFVVFEVLILSFIIGLNSNEKLLVANFIRKKIKENI